MGSPQVYKFVDVPQTGVSTSGHAYDWELAQVHLVAHDRQIMDIHSHLNEILSLLRTNPQEDEHVVPIRVPPAVPVSTATSPHKYPEGYSLPQWWHPTRKGPVEIADHIPSSWKGKQTEQGPYPAGPTPVQAWTVPHQNTPVVADDRHQVFPDCPNRVSRYPFASWAPSEASNKYYTRIDCDAQHPTRQVHAQLLRQVI